MAPHSITLAWEIPGMGEPGGLPSIVSHRVGHDQSDLAAAAAAAAVAVFYLDKNKTNKQKNLCSKMGKGHEGENDWTWFEEQRTVLGECSATKGERGERSDS